MTAISKTSRNPVPHAKKLKSATRELDDLRDEWRTMYTETLPKAARMKDSSQQHWPVSLDHCFARIILDAVAGDTPWMAKIKSPAYKNMNEEQLRMALHIGQEILDGKTSLADLDEQSLALRGKKSKVKQAAVSTSPNQKRERSDDKNDSYKPANGGSVSKKVKIDLTQDDHIDLTREDDIEGDGGERSGPPMGDEDRTELEAMIDTSEKSEFQKRCLKLLIQIPEGHFSTYGAMAKALGSAPRAVGNAMRNNPFAPRVPCHRILAADRTIGGFGGSWGVEGKHYNEKMELLHKEGVKFDSKGRVLGPVFEAFAPV